MFVLTLLAIALFAFGLSAVVACAVDGRFTPWVAPAVVALLCGAAYIDQLSPDGGDDDRGLVLLCGVIYAGAAVLGTVVGLLLRGRGARD